MLQTVATCSMIRFVCVWFFLFSFVFLIRYCQNEQKRSLSWVPADEEDQDQMLQLLDKANREALL